MASGTIKITSNWIDISDKFSSTNTALNWHKAIYNINTKEVKIEVSYSNLLNTSVILTCDDSRYYPDTTLLYLVGTNYILFGFAFMRYTSSATTTTPYAAGTVIFTDQKDFKILQTANSNCWGSACVSYITV